ncbi:MAG: OmpH family outer membrane protein, partial [Janthinobacterium lividum]
MKRLLLTLILPLLATTAVFAQRFAYVDSEYILKHIPEYASTQKQIASISDQWQKETDARFQEIDRMY